MLTIYGNAHYFINDDNHDLHLFLTFVMVQNLKEYIVKTNKKSGNNNLCYCKACFAKLGENSLELKTIVDKTERLITHFKNCKNFHDTYDNEEKSKVLTLTQKRII